VTDDKQLIDGQIALAREAWDAADILLTNRSYRAAINRLYYACFYAVEAVLLTHGLSAKTHAGVRILFNAHVIRDSELPKVCGDLYTRLFDMRHETDYSVLIDIDPLEVQAWLPQVRDFIDRIAQLTA